MNLLVYLRAGDVFPFKGLHSSLQKEKSNYYQKEVDTQVIRNKQILLNTTWPPLSFPIYFLISSYTLSPAEAQALLL